MLLLTGVTAVFPYAITYKEQYYNLFHTHYQQYPEDVIENIYWLERAAAADFCNPQYALAKITDETTSINAEDWASGTYIWKVYSNNRESEIGRDSRAHRARRRTRPPPSFLRAYCRYRRKDSYFPPFCIVFQPNYSAFPPCGQSRGRLFFRRKGV